jgi:hypothetical protein
MLAGEKEVSQVLSFVSSNASRLLQLDAPSVLPISGRAGETQQRSTLIDAGCSVHAVRVQVLGFRVDPKPPKPKCILTCACMYA